MALKGDLASVDLAQVFQMLALNQKVGMLCISSPRGWRALYFEPRGACLYFDEHVLLDKVVGQAERNGHLLPDAVAEARRHAAAQGTGLADALIAGGYLSEPDITAMLRGEMEEQVYDLFFWTDAHFEFYEGANTVEGREGCVDPRFVFSTDTLIMEAARRIDEWSFIQERIAGPLELYRPVGNATNVLELEDSALALYDLVDGKRNVGRLVEITGLPAFLVYKGIAVLLDEGLVDAVPTDELLQIAADCEREGRHQDAINVYEKAITLGEGIPDSHSRAAKVYETLQEFELAAYHNKCVAEFCARADDVKRGVEILKHVVEVLPTDLAARERLVELTVGRPDLATKDFDPVAHGKELVDLYLEIGEIERVRSILERLIRDNPFDIELKKSLINVHTKAGDSKRVVELYESIAEDLVQDRRPLEAIKYLQKILMLDRNRKDISERIRSLYVMDERRRSRRRSMIALCVVGLLVTVLGVVWWYYDQYARDRLVTVQTRVETLLQSSNYENALGELRAFNEQFPLTLVSREVQVEISRIEALQLRHRQQAEQEQRKRAEELARLRERYRALWDTVEPLVVEQKLDEALQRAEEVERLVQQASAAGQSADREWAIAAKLEPNLARLRNYIAKAMDLDRRGRDAWRNGDWQTARQHWLQLVNDHGMAQTTRLAKLPVLITSRPEGALVLKGGTPIPSGTDGDEPRRTPCVVLCAHQQKEVFELQLDGFAPRQVVVDSRTSDKVVAVLEAKPAQILRFSEPVRGQITIQRGYLAAGLRGGRIGYMRLADGSENVHQLAGLDELDGKVALSASSMIFVTREGSLGALSLADGSRQWNIPLPGGRPAHDPVLHNGRLLFVDERQRFIGLDVTRKGQPIWNTTPLGGIAGAPVLSDSTLLVALTDGDVLVFDASDGRLVDRLPVGTRLATGAVEAGGAYIVGSEDGRVLAVRADTGGLLWELVLPPGAVADRLRLAPDTLLVRSTDGRLFKVAVRSGAIEATATMPGRLTSGPEISDDRVLVTVRDDERNQDTLLTMRLTDLETLWEFRDGGVFTADVVTHGSEIFLSDSKGQVLRFR